jgi:hypothetical protein
MNSIMTDYYPLFRLYQRMREQVLDVLDVLSEEDLVFQPSGDNVALGVLCREIGEMIYQEALLIFYGKVSVYLKMLEKTPSEQWRHWIA